MANAAINNTRKHTKTVHAAINRDSPILYWVIRSLEGNRSRVVKEGLLIFSTEKNAHVHMSNLGVGESYYLTSLSWEEIVEKSRGTYRAVVLDYLRREEKMRIISIRKPM